jgi:hypothetical protein
MAAPKWIWLFAAVSLGVVSVGLAAAVPEMQPEVVGNTADSTHGAPPEQPGPSARDQMRAEEGSREEGGSKGDDSGGDDDGDDDGGDDAERDADSEAPDAIDQGADTQATSPPEPDASSTPEEPAMGAVGGAATADADAFVPILHRPKIPQPQYETGPRQPCSRAKSREARQIIEERMLAKARAFGVQMDPRCKLSPQTDMLLAHEANKSALAAAQWKCKTCGKVFRTEGYLDMHFDRRHMDTVPTDANVCLADFCDILGCRSLRPSAGVACNPQQQQRRRVLCQHLIHNCFPPSLNAEYWHVHEMFERGMCDGLTCAPSTFAAVREGSGKTLRIVGTVVISILIVVIACAVGCHKLEARTGPDLRRRSGRPKASRGRAASWMVRLGLRARAHSD